MSGMATVEHTIPPLPGLAEERPAQPVFSADDGRRERALRVVGRIVAVVVGVWLLALFAGAMGFGRLPLIPGSGLLDRANQRAKAPEETPRANLAGGNRETSFAARTVGAPAAGRADRRAGSTVSARARARAHRAAPAAAHPPSSQLAPPAVPPASPGKPQGRAVRRHGIPVQPAPPPPANGNAYGQAVVNPGRLKNQVPPPPPPPPPPSKKP
jgi:hypothetical protein